MSLNVDAVLERKGLNRSKLAGLLGRKNNRSYVTNILKNPTVGTLEKIATALNVDVVELFDSNFEEGMKPIYDQDGKVIGYLKKGI